MKTAKKPQIHLEISAELKARFFELADQQGINPSGLIRRWILDWVEKHNDDHSK